MSVINLDTSLIKFINDDLARSGLTPDDFDLVASDARPAITPVASIQRTIKTTAYVLDGFNILFPAEDHSGYIDNFSVIRFRGHPEGKYEGTKDKTYPFWSVKYSDWLMAPVKWIVEGEKKSLAFTKYTGLPSIGIRGCWGFMRAGEPMPEILSGIKPGDRVGVVIDGDIATNHSIRMAAGTLARVLMARGAAEVFFPILPAPSPGKPRMGADDWVMSFTPADRMPEVLVPAILAIPRGDWREFPESPQAMARRLNLMQEGPPDKRKVLRNDENTRIILEDLFGHRALFTDQYKGPMFQNLKGEAIPYSDDTLDSELYRYFERSFGTWSKESFRSVRRAMISQTRRNLLGEYISSVQWDGVPRIESLLETYFGAEPSEYTRKISKGQCLGSIARCMEPGVKWDHILILEGEQRTGKSHGLELLYYDYYVAVNMSLASDQLARKVTSSWCTNCDELDHMHKTGRESFKAWSTERYENWVPKYVEYAKTTPRPSVITGTTNKRTYLDDPTGAQRFWPCKVGVTHVVQHAKIIQDRDQIWAEAYYIYSNAPDTWWREFENDRTGALEHQDMRGMEDPLAELFEAALAVSKVPRDVDGRAFVTHHWLASIAHSSALPTVKKSMPAISDAIERCKLVRKQLSKSKIGTASLLENCREMSNRKVLDDQFAEGYVPERVRVFYLPEGTK